MASNEIMTLTDQNFHKMVLQSDIPTLVDFWADWCEPCKMIAPHLEAIASEHKGKIRVGKMDIDHSPGTPTNYNIRSIPTLILFRGEQVLGQLIGAVSKAKIEQFLKDALAKLQ